MKNQIDFTQGLACFVLLSALPSLLCAQPQAPDAPEAPELAQMKKLHWWIGDWEGEGWAAFGGPRHPFKIREKIESRLGGLVLVVEGRGTTKPPGQEKEITTHDAFGVISYDQESHKYRFRSWRIPGSVSVDAELSLDDDNTMRWGFQTGRGHLRFTIRLNEKGEWHETGEMSRDGTEWRQFHEMTLRRVGSPAK